MPNPSISPLRSVGERAPVPLSTAALGWLGAWLAGGLVASAILASSGHDSVAAAGPWWLAAAQLANWSALVAVVVVLGRRYGSGGLGRDFGLSFRAIDLVGVPIGVLAQLVLVRLLYWPLEEIWPATFGQERLEERTRELWDSAHGAGLALLVVVVVLGAPLVEELVYRGLLQGALTRRLTDVLGLGLAATWFALIHFQPVEYPGLFVAGLTFGVCMVWTDRLGMGVLAHMAFNASALALAAGR